MIVIPESIADVYERELLSYIDEQDEHLREVHLVRGYELGREAADTGVSLFTLSEAHHRVVARLCAESSGEAAKRCVDRAAEFFSEGLASFEMVLQGYRAQVAALEAQERRLVAAQQEADRANRAKSDFLSGMSHELRTPLNAILGFSQLLELEDLRDEHRINIGLIKSAGEHLLDLINEVLDISRIESGHLDLTLETVPVAGVIDETVQMVRAMAVDRDVQIHAVPSDKCVVADRQRLKQVLVNLVANAIKYNRDSGSVVIRSDGDGDHVRILVTDSGVGIDPDAIDRLFLPFERLDVNPEIEGTGLGLAMVKRLTEAMGGTIGVQSVVEQGSTFWIEFPQTSIVDVSGTAD